MVYEKHAMLFTCMAALCLRFTFSNPIKICVTGYIMDTFCIQRGTLLDNQHLPTLKYPGEHSVHCLVDVPMCYESGFEVLQDPANTASSIHCRLLKLDEKGNKLALDVARQLGDKAAGCATCTTEKGSLKKVFERLLLVWLTTRVKTYTQ